MCDFNVEEIKTAITSYDHNGNEMDLQCILARSLGLCLANCNANCKFSPSINNFNKNQNGAGLELGFKPQPVSLPPKVKDARRYIDLASVNWEPQKQNNEPASINWLCEVKIIKPDRYSYNGKWYPYIYKLMINGSKPFDFLAKVGDKNIATDADEGQIIFDFIKMMACRQKTQPINAPIYQIIAIKKECNIKGFDDCKKAVVEVLNSWKSHLDLTTDSTAQIYAWKDFVTQERGQKVALECKLKDVTGCAITDLGSSNEYQHILIDWQPKGGKSDFAF